MRALIAFTKKEWMESIRTYKFFILMTIFLLFGFMNPLAAKVMPELLNSFLPEGMTITLTPPAAIDAWMQFFKNVSQMGFIILVVIYSGMMATELSKGTLINMLTKGLPRRTVVCSKMLASSMIWTLAYLVCVAITYLYTGFFWTMAGISNLFLSLVGLWLFGILLLSFVLLGGILFKNFYGSLLFTGAAVVILNLINIFPKAVPFNPATLSTQNVALLTDAIKVSDFTMSLGICAALIAVVLVVSVVVFDRNQI